VAVIKSDGQAPGIRGDVARRARIPYAGQPSADPATGSQPSGSQYGADHYRGGQQGTLFGEDAAPEVEEVGYRGTTACAAAGITYRQLDYWARTGLVEPSVRPASGSGSQRLYGFRDILALKIVKRLLDTGISLQQIRAAVAYLREQGAGDVTQVTLMSDGASVYACTSPDEVVDLLQGGQGVFGIALGRVWQEVEGTLADLPAERAENPGTGDDVQADPGEAGAGPDELARRRARRTGS
jgi:DNA-binding transcriptional MerR regulator